MTIETDIQRPAFDASKHNAISIRHYRFAQKYVELNHNGTQAYLAVYGKEYLSSNGREMSKDVANASAARLLVNVNVSSYIAEIANELIYETKINSATIIARYNRWADSDITEILWWEEQEIFDNKGISFSPPRFSYIVKVRDLKDIPADAISSIKSIQSSSKEFSVTLVDKLQSNNMLARFLGLTNNKDKAERKIILHFDKEQS